MRNRGSRCLVCALIVLITDSLAKAQTGSGTIQGTVTDPTGAVVPGASVTATNIATGVQTPRSTTAAGLYVLSPLPPGRYNLQVTASGFQPHALEGITVDALATIGLDVTLKVGTSCRASDR